MSNNRGDIRRLKSTTLAKLQQRYIVLVLYPRSLGYTAYNYYLGHIGVLVQTRTIFYPYIGVPPPLPPRDINPRH